MFLFPSLSPLHQTALQNWSTLRNIYQAELERYCLDPEGQEGITPEHLAELRQQAERASAAAREQREREVLNEEFHCRLVVGASIGVLAALAYRILTRSSLRE